MKILLRQLLPAPFVVALAAAVFAAAVPARADVVQTYEVSGTFTDNTQITGTIVIDSTTGVLESGDLSYLGEQFNVLDSTASYPAAGLYAFFLSTSSGFYPLQDFAIAGASLVGFDGAPLCSSSDVCSGISSAYSANGGNALFLETGTVTPQTGSPSATPEPGSLALLSTGVFGLAAVARRRLKRS